MTVASVPLRAAVKYRDESWTWPTWWSARTSSKRGSGFQMPGVVGDCLMSGQFILSFPQSGS